jgi:hypothetical protein
MQTLMLYPLNLPQLKIAFPCQPALLRFYRSIGCFYNGQDETSSGGTVENTFLQFCTVLTCGYFAMGDVM